MILGLVRMVGLNETGTHESYLILFYSQIYNSVRGTCNSLSHTWDAECMRPKYGNMLQMSQIRISQVRQGSVQMYTK